MNRRWLPVVVAGGLVAALTTGTAYGASHRTVAHHHLPAAKAFHTSGTYTVPKGVHHLVVTMWGAGGAGGNSSPHSPSLYAGGGGGGQGAYVKGKLHVSPGQKLKVTVGVGGPITGVSGANGTPSAIGGLVAAGGFGGGQPTYPGPCTSGVGGAGGAASTVGGHVVASHAGIAGTHGRCAGSLTGQGGKGGGANDKTGKGKHGSGGDGQGGSRLSDPGRSGYVLVKPVHA